MAAPGLLGSSPTPLAERCAEHPGSDHGDSHPTLTPRAPFIPAPPQPPPAPHMS
jgi:hypothetical protein